MSRAERGRHAQEICGTRSARPVHPRARPRGGRVRWRSGRVGATQRAIRHRRDAGRRDAEARAAVGRAGSVRPAEGVLRRRVGVRPLLPAANAALVQREDDRRRRRRGPARSCRGPARAVRGRAHVDVHAEARHQVRTAAPGRDRDRPGLHPRDGAGGVRRRVPRAATASTTRRSRGSTSSRPATPTRSAVSRRPTTRR